MPKRDENPAITRAVLDVLGLRADACRAYCSGIAVWIEGIPHRAPFLAKPAQWSEKRGAYYVDVRRGIPARQDAPQPVEPVRAPLAIVRETKPKPKRAPAASSIPAHWSRDWTATGGGLELEEYVIRQHASTARMQYCAQAASAEAARFNADLRAAVPSPAFHWTPATDADAIAESRKKMQASERNRRDKRELQATILSAESEAMRRPAALASAA